MTGTEYVSVKMSEVDHYGLSLILIIISIDRTIKPPRLNKDSLMPLSNQGTSPERKLLKTRKDSWGEGCVCVCVTNTRGLAIKDIPWFGRVSNNGTGWRAQKTKKLQPKYPSTCDNLCPFHCSAKNEWIIWYLTHSTNNPTPFRWKVDFTTAERFFQNFEPFFVLEKSISIKIYT